MSRIMILGGTGYTGRLIAQHLLEQSQVDVTISTRHLSKAQAFADQLNQKFSVHRVKATYADASKSDSLRKAFADQTLVVIAAPTTAFTADVIQVALEMGVDYLDVQLSREKLALLESSRESIELAGRCFITEAGFHPGLPSALVRYAASKLDTIESAITLGYLNMGKDLPYSEAVDELIEAFRDYKGQVFKAGKWTNPNSFDIRNCDFGGDIGRKRCYAMFFEELRSLPGMFPSLRDTGFYMSEMHWFLDWVIYPITLAWLKLAPNANRPIGKFLWWGMGTFHKPPYRVELQVQATGIKDGQLVDLCASVAHPNGYELTAIPVVATLLQYLDNSTRKSGLWMMGHFVEPCRLMEDMENMGVTCSTELNITSNNVNVVGGMAQDL